MNKISKFYIVVILGFVFSSLVSDNCFSQLPRPVPTAYPQNSQPSFVKTWNATAPEQDPNYLMTRHLKDIKQSTQYLDGLGRHLQTVAKEYSMQTGNIPEDMVSAIEYDEYDKELYKYSPFAANTNGGYPTNDGKFRLNPFQQQASFMTAQYGSQNETFFYSKTNFEPSPLNRVTDAYAPGNSWVGSEGNPEAQRRNVQMKYFINTINDVVKIWKVTNAPLGSWGIYEINTTINSGNYPAGELYKNVTVDEHKKQVIEFKDKEGRVILKKVQLTATADDGTGRDHTGWLCTYYIYDDLSNLRCVIQPQAVSLMNNPVNWNLSPYLTEQCFRYEYDQRNRMIMKKVPGAGEVSMVYDNRDRLVMTQDANMRQAPAKWMLTKYDVLNRPIETGLWNNNGLLFNAHLSNAYNNTTEYPVVAGNYEMLTHNHYDDYVGLPGGLSSNYINTWDNTYFTPTSNNSWPYPQMPIQSNAVKGMATWSQVKVLGTTNTYLSSVTIYDEKGRPIQVQSINNTGGLDVITTQYSWVGQPLVTVQKQDKQGVPVQSHIVVAKITYDDLGRVMNIKKTINSVINGVNVVKPELEIVSNQYDKLGQLITKNIGKKKDANNNYTNAPIETLNYDYNIRGWLLGVNRNYLTDNNANTGSNYFAFELGYNKTDNKAGNNFSNPAQFNGNINGMLWKSRGDGIRREYSYAYDAANRLLKGDFIQNNADNSWNKNTVNYSMQMGNGADPTTAYDANGNIMAMKQYGFQIGATNPATNLIDNLTYNYKPLSNKLLNVIDLENKPATKLGDFRTSALHPEVNTKTNSTVDYDYDDNGNLKYDLNKDIVSTAGANGIQYNYLNLPSVITVAKDAQQNPKGTISYIYDAAGNKLRKTTVESNATVVYNSVNYSTQITTITNYIGGFVYETKSYSNTSIPAAAINTYTDQLQFLAHEEGRIRFKKGDNAVTPAIPPSFEYDYMLKDHLGNVRAVLTDEVQKDIYPPVTFEDASLATEQLFYQNLDIGRVARPDLFNSPSTNGAKVQVLQKNTNAIGAGQLLKVMNGDKFTIQVQYYIPTAAVNNSQANGLNSILTSLLNTLNAATSLGAIHGSGVPLTNQLNNNVNFNTLLSPQGSSFPSSNPKAFLNIIFFDEQFVFEGQSSRIIQTGTMGSPQQIVLTGNDMPVAKKNGYVYIFVSNESNNLVYFDNLQVLQEKSSLIEETHYYPFGLTMAGISSKAAGTIQNKEKTFQGQRFDDDLELNWVQFKWRNHDPQIGRFIEIDPLAEDYVYNSTYAFSENKVTNHIELEGLEAVFVGDPKQYLMEGFRQIGQAAGRLIDKVNIFRYEGEVHLNYNKNVEVKAGSVSSNATVSVSENTASFKFGSFEDLFKSNKSPIEFKAESNTLSKVEVKNAINATVNGVPLEASQKTTIDGSGTKNTISAGPKITADAGNIKADGSAQVYYSNQMSGTNAGQQAVGIRVAVDATFVSKKTPIINTPAVQVSTSNQTKVGASLQWNYKWPQ